MTKTYSEDEIREALTAQGVAPETRSAVMCRLNKPKVTFREGEVIVSEGGNVIFHYVPHLDNGRNYSRCRPLNHSELPQRVHDLVDTMRVLASEDEFLSESGLYEDELLRRIDIAREALAAYRKAGGAE